MNIILDGNPHFSAASMRPSQHNLAVGYLSVEVHWLSADNRYRLIIGRLFVFVSKTTKMLVTAVHIDDNEITNDSVITNQSRVIFNIQQNKVKMGRN